MSNPFDQFDASSAGAAPAGMAQPATPEGAPVAAGNPPGFDATTAAAAQQQTAMTARAQSYANDMFPLFKAQEQLAAAPTGAASEAGYRAGAILQTYAPEWLHRAAAFTTTLGGSIGGIMTPEQISAYAEAKKYLTQAQLGVSGATRSNEGGQTASAASPSVDIPKPAAQAVLQNMIGLRRMEQDQTIQWQQSGLPVQALPGFVSRFQTNADPRVYVWDQLSPAQRGQIYSRMNADQQKAFTARVNLADSNGIYNTFGMGGAAAVTALKTNDAYDNLFDYYGHVYNVDPLLTKTVFHVESGGNPNPPRGGAGEEGGLQITPGLAAHYGIDPRDMAQAIPAATAYLAEGLQATGGDPARAVAYYNGGPKTLQRVLPSTENYVAKAQSYYPQMQLAANAAPADQMSDVPSGIVPAQAQPSDDAFRSRWGIGAAAPLASADDQAFRSRWGIANDNAPPAQPAIPVQPQRTISDSAASTPPPRQMGNPLTALNAAGGDQFIPNPLASNTSQSAYATLRGALDPAPNTTYGNVLPFAQDNTTGANRIALPAPLRALAQGAVDLAYGPHTGTITPEGSAALATGVVGGQRLMRSPANIPGRFTVFPNGGAPGASSAPSGAPTAADTPGAVPTPEIPAPTFARGVGRTFDVDPEGNVTDAALPAVRGVPLTTTGQSASANPLASRVAPSTPAAASRSVQASPILSPIEERLVAAIEGPKAEPLPSGPFNILGGMSAAGGSTAPPPGTPPPGTPPPGTPGYTPTTPGVSPAQAASMSPAEMAIHAAIRDTPPPSPMVPPQTQAAANALADQVIRYFYAGKPALSPADAIVPPGYHPSLTGVFNDPGLATLHRGMESVSSAPAMLADSNAQAVNAAAQRLTGQPGDADLMRAEVNRITTPMREEALANKTAMDPAKVQAAIDAADKLIAGPHANRPGALQYIQQVRDTLGKPSDRSVPETDPEMMLGAHQGINDLLSPLAQSTNADKAAAASALIKLKPLVKDAIESGAPGMKDYFATHAELMKAPDAQRFLEGLNLTNATGDTRLAAVDSAIKSITRQQNAPGISKAEWISPDQFGELVALRNALRMEASRGTGKPINSTTFQNMATNSRVAQLAANPLINLSAGQLYSPGPVGLAAGLGTRAAIEALNARSRDMFSNALLRRLLNVNGEGEAALAAPAPPSGPRAGRPGPGAPWNPLRSGAPPAGNAPPGAP